MIQVGFSYRRGNLVSWLIRKITRSRVSHVWLAIMDPHFGSTILVMEAEFTGWQMVDLTQFLKKNTIVSLIQPKVSLATGLQLSAKWLGEPYNFEGLLGAFIVVVGQWLKRKWKNPWESPKSVFCSEAIVRILQASNYPGAQNLDPGSASPGQILTFLEEAK
jgi:hypothetical protein